MPEGLKFYSKLLCHHINAQRSPGGSLVILDAYGNVPDPEGRTDFSQLDLWYDIGMREGTDVWGTDDRNDPEHLGLYESGVPTTEGDEYESIGYSIGATTEFMDFAVEGGFEYGDWI